MMGRFSFFCYKDPTLTHCKNCSEAALHYSKPRNLFESIANILPCIGVYRCHQCNWRGIKLEISAGEGLLNKVILSILVMLISALVILYILKVVIAR